MSDRVFDTTDEDDRYGFNPFYNPAKCGLELVAQLEDDEPYEFNTIIDVAA